MRREPLRIEQRKAALPQPHRPARGAPPSRHPSPRETSTPRKTPRRCATPYSPPASRPSQPRLHRVRVAEPVQLHVARDDLLIDPRLLAPRARAHHRLETPCPPESRNAPFSTSAAARAARESASSGMIARGSGENHAISPSSIAIGKTALRYAWSSRSRRNHRARGLCRRLPARRAITARLRTHFHLPFSPGAPAIYARHESHPRLDSRSPPPASSSPVAKVTCRPSTSRNAAEKLQRGVTGQGTLVQPDHSNDPIIREKTRVGN